MRTHEPGLGPVLPLRPEIMAFFLGGGVRGSHLRGIVVAIGGLCLKSEEVDGTPDISQFVGRSQMCFGILEGADGVIGPHRESYYV